MEWSAFLKFMKSIFCKRKEIRQHFASFNRETLSIFILHHADLRQIHLTRIKWYQILKRIRRNPLRKAKESRYVNYLPQPEVRTFFNEDGNAFWRHVYYLCLSLWHPCIVKWLMSRVFTSRGQCASVPVPSYGLIHCQLRNNASLYWRWKGRVGWGEMRFNFEFKIIALI